MLYERQIDPIERPAAICPGCHRNTILCDINVLVIPEPGGEGTLFSPYGRLHVRGQDKALCNSYGCGWVGTFKEARDAIVGTVEAISNGRGFRIWVKPSELVGAPPKE